MATSAHFEKIFPFCLLAVFLHLKQLKDVCVIALELFLFNVWKSFKPINISVLLLAVTKLTSLTPEEQEVF